LIKKAKKTNSKIKSQINTGVLVLENKKVFKGIGIGYQGEATGEVCFNTSLTGYQEIISDPSYAGQIINFTFPHIGNVGTNKEDHESDKIWTRGVIFNSEITSPSNYRSLQNLDKWLKKNKIVGITGLDTRSLTNFIRDKGAPKGTISNNKRDLNRYKWNKIKLDKFLKDKKSKQKIYYDHITNLLKIRIKQKAFHPNASMQCISFGKKILAFKRISLDKKQTIICITNLSSMTQRTHLDKVYHNWNNLIGSKIKVNNSLLILKPFETIWLSNR